MRKQQNLKSEIKLDYVGSLFKFFNLIFHHEFEKNCSFFL